MAITSIAHAPIIHGLPTDFTGESLGAGFGVFQNWALKKFIIDNLLHEFYQRKKNSRAESKEYRYHRAPMRAAAQLAGAEKRRDTNKHERHDVWIVLRVCRPPPRE